jgi:hypothetical protein
MSRFLTVPVDLVEVSEAMAFLHDLNKQNTKEAGSNTVAQDKIA